MGGGRGTLNAGDIEESEFGEFVLGDKENVSDEVENSISCELGVGGSVSGGGGSSISCEVEPCELIGGGSPMPRSEGGRSSWGEGSWSGVG